MKIEELKNKKIAILGVGIEGIATATYLAKHNISCVLLDESTNLDKHIIEKVQQLSLPLKCEKDIFTDLSEYQIVFRSPGIPSDSSYLAEFSSKGGMVTSQTNLFFDNCPCQIIGITGTKGKGTTSALIYEMLKNANKDAYLGGNIGVSSLEFLDTLSDQSIVVLELSSFQLEDLKSSPHIAVVLMITSEHLTHHKNVENYVAAKRNILNFQKADDFAIINRDYPASHESDIYTNGTCYQVSRERVISDNGCFVRDNAVWVSKGNNEEKIIDINEIILPGKHNLENVCAAVMAVKLAGVSKKHIIPILQSFKGLDHRLQLIRIINGVSYYDDSIATNPESTIAAIEAFENKWKILILGGVTEGSDFTQLGKVIASSKNIKAIIGIGKEWPIIKQAIGKPTNNMLFLEGAISMEQVVLAADKITLPGDIVLLSPACKSFDMFKNYKDRGEQFKKIVLQLHSN